MHFPRTRRAHHSDEAILPLTNVVFLLLIFFMLAGRLTSPRPFDVDPPQSASEATAEYQGLEVQIAANGNLALDGDAVALDILAERVRERLQSEPDTPLRLKADGAGDATRVVAVMHVLRDAGAEKLRLITVAAQP